MNVDTSSPEFRRQNRRYWVILALMLAGLTLFGAFLWWSSRMKTGDYLSDYGGAPSVYEQIAGSSDCVGLMETWNRASANHELAVNNGRSAEVDWTTGYMNASADRMQQLGC